MNKVRVSLCLLFSVCFTTIVFTQVPSDIPGGVPPISIPDVNLPTPDLPTDEERIGVDDVRKARDEKTAEEEREKRQIGIGKGVGIKVDSIGIYGHDYIRTNNFEFYERAVDVKVDDEYILGPGDNITVSIWNNADIENDNFTISKGGFVELSTYGAKSGFGRIYLAGLTFGKARELLRTQYSKYYNFDREDFDVALTAARTINIDIVGEVEEPGSFTIPAINTVYNVLKLSGGPTVNGSVRNIQIKRNGKVIQKLDVYEYLSKAENRQNIYLEDNDVVFVPQIGKVVEIEGAVKKETKFELKGNENWPQLLFYAGGYKPNALKNRVQIFRYDDDEYKIKDYAFDRENPYNFKGKLIDGDLIIIKEIPAEANNIVTTEGALNQVGYYEFEPGMRVSELIEKSSGLRFDAVTTRAYLTRYNDDLQAVNIPIKLDEIIKDSNSESNILLFPKDHLEILSKSDFADEFKVQIFGQVKKEGNYIFGSSLTLQDLLIKAGGFKTDALTQEIELRRVVDYSEEEGRLIPVRDVVKKFKVDYEFMNPDNSNNKLQLQPYDQIFVRSIPEFEVPTTVRIEGEVKLPGHYPILTKDLRISDIIETAGGLTPYAYKEGTKFYRKTDSIFLKQDTILLDSIGNELYNSSIDSDRVRNSVDTLMIDSVLIKTYKDRVLTSRPYVVDLNKVYRNKSSEHNLVLKPGDRIVIPTIDETVSIGGAIRTVVDDTSLVNTAYQGNKSAKWYINNFGAGFDKDAWKRTTQVVYPNGQAVGTKKFLFFNVYPEVKPGSDIEVAYKPPRDPDRPSFFGDLSAQKTIALITSAVTTTALILAVSRR